MKTIWLRALERLFHGLIDYFPSHLPLLQDDAQEFGAFFGDGLEFLREGGGLDPVLVRFAAAPIRFADLLKASDSILAHDVLCFGI